MTYYRYEDPRMIDINEYSNHLELLTYEVLKITQCGVWIKYPERNKWYLSTGKIVEGKKFILEKSDYGRKETTKRFALPTEGLALISYIKRKELQIAILENKLSQAKTYLDIANRIKL